MKTGKTNYEVNTRIRITFIDDEDSKELEGQTGTLTHPFSGYMTPGFEKKYIAGVYLDRNIGAWGNGSICNLMKGDKFEVIEG